jgi:Putative auto-transporter adhesin, head GIN domain
MKNIVIYLVIMLSAHYSSNAQKTTKTYDYKNFDKVSFLGFNGDVQVKIGETWKVEVTSSNNDFTFLQFTFDEKETQLTLKYEKTDKYSDYEKWPKYTIAITMPEASVIVNSGNSDVQVTGIVGRYFRAENFGNGDFSCKGSTDELEVKNYGNGTVDATNLLAKKAKVNNTGNGDIQVNVTNELEAKTTGNGDVTNKGTADFNAKSSKTGNGKLIKQ